MLLWRFLQRGSFFWNDRPLDWADLYTDAAVYTGGKVNPVPVKTFDVFAWTRMNASHRTGIDAIAIAFTGFSNNRVRHSFFCSDFEKRVKTFVSSLTE